MTAREFTALLICALGLMTLLFISEYWTELGIRLASQWLYPSRSQLDLHLFLTARAIGLLVFTLMGLILCAFSRFWAGKVLDECEPEAVWLTCPKQDVQKMISSLVGLFFIADFFLNKTYSLLSAVNSPLVMNVMMNLGAGLQLLIGVYLFLGSKRIHQTVSEGIA